MKPLLFFLWSLSIFPVLHAQNLLVVEGRIDSWKNKKVFLLKAVSHTAYGNLYEKIDSVHTRSGKFGFKQPVQEVNFYALATEDLTNKVQFIWDTIIQIQGKDVHSITLQGSILSQSWRTFQQTVIDPIREKKQELELSYQNALIQQDSALLKTISAQKENVQNQIMGKEINFLGGNLKNFLSLHYLTYYWQLMGVEGSQRIINIWPEKLKNHSLTTQLLKEIKIADTVTAGNKAPVIITRDVDGIPFNSSTLAGKYILIDFWGTWCGPCIALLPELKEAYLKYKDKNVEFVSIAYEKKEDVKNIKPLIRGRYNITWTQLYQEKGNSHQDSIIKKYMIESFPTVVLISPEGKIVSKASSKEGLAKAKQILDSVLEK
ncbi:TlpA disulfide reductase family protein [Cytophagaceae bacterium DM2B3-1]|uniref:TlpA disulfide reductase family protein n=1 Tax=Xanthocytophaga flava TaxID=3048013 RepID=A0ABT7CXS1_9BACT|nr:TlpA disulfide reductase family protein [Xanthocytophaga flavus]MDJ1472888.1 TlpA disulfide reductase family protein [Xanthocytophaga flavus]MDJ1498570.1 TlpA disulfide reductase family protein [Xanthocytophaga flavus]